jgi:SAM-dependent methyltransferase
VGAGAFPNVRKKSWNRFSPGWEKWDDFTMRFLEPQGAAILDAMEVGDGAKVLDIATGTGDPGLTLARRVPGAHVTGVDASEGMLRVAGNKARAQGLDNFRAVVGDACALEFADGSFDAVSCRLGFMFFPSTPLAAREMARVVRPGGVVAATVWAGPAENSWITTMVGAIKKHLSLPSPPPGAPGMFRCADPDALPGLFAEAGLSIERRELLTGPMQCRSPEEYWQFMNDVVAPVVAALADAAPDTVATIKAEVFAALERLGQTSGGGLSWGAYSVVARR